MKKILLICAALLFCFVLYAEEPRYTGDVPRESAAPTGGGMPVAETAISTPVPGQQADALARTLDVTAEPSPVTVVAVPEMPVDPEALTKAAWTPKNIYVDTSLINAVRLRWETGQKENIYYNVYRSFGRDYIPQTPSPLTVTVFVDVNILSATAYHYRIDSADLSGNVYQSDTVTVTTPDILPPYPPANFKAYQDVQQVVLKWTGAPQGSFPLSTYNVYRGRSADKLELIKVLSAAKNAYNDEDVEGGIKYFYAMTAADIKGGESRKTEAQGVVPFPPSQTSVVLMPTGFRNNIFDNYGLNIDAGFAYYIGSIFGQHDVGGYGSKTDTFAKNGIWLLSVDAKWSFFNPFENWPSLALGVDYTLLLRDKIGSSETTNAGATFSTKDSVLGLQYMFASASKKAFWETTVHAGYSLGFKLYKDDKGKGAAGYIPYLVNTILGSEAVDSASAETGERVIEARNAYYLGFSRPFFGKMGLKAEYLVPVDMNKNFALPNTYIINTHIDRFINFDLAYLHYDGGYAWLGYINLRFSIFPSPYK
ncbi:MAG: hypothetical protein LLG37_08980 [Spirochaetia bacterium]|nr:hypothetical protein [Spirochaetia bacterium]